MTDRSALKRAFLNTTDWATAQVEAMTGDASNRRYDRLYLPGKTAILMDAAPERGEDVRPFIRIAEHLLHHGFSAPKILARQVEQGFLVLEDLGNDRFKEVIEATPACEGELYRAAVDALVTLHNCPLPDDLPDYGPDTMVKVCDPVFSEYRKTVAPGPVDQAQKLFDRALTDLLQRYVGPPSVLAQRDYHAENLLWLPDRNGVARVGMLDFQDAVAGHPAYDLVSMLQDARRDVAPDTEAAMIAHYLNATGLDAQGFHAAYWALGLQRNLRIVGVFARLATKLGKPHYVDFIPRVWTYIERGLTRPEFTEFRAVLRETVPTPTEDVLRKLKP